MPLHGRFFALAAAILSLGNTPRDLAGLLTLDTSNLSHRDIDSLKSSSAVEWWVQGGEKLLVATSEAPARDAFAVLCGAHVNEMHVDVASVFKGGRCMVVAKTVLQQYTFDEHVSIKPLDANMVLSSLADDAAITWSDAERQAALTASALIDGDRWFADVKTLAGWNRHVRAGGNADARDFIAKNLSNLEGIVVSSQEFEVSGQKAWNVIGTYASGLKDADTILVTGHYDSISQSIATAAPGAEDNATGAAGVIELARNVVATRPKTNVVFIAFSGEEQGLIGSTFYAKTLSPTAQAKIKAVINMDMIGYTKDDSLDILLETSSEFKTVSDHFAAAAKTATKLRVFTSFNPFGSDHMPFINRHIPALLTIDNDWDSYPSYHRTTDTTENVSQAMGTEALKMNAAAIAAWSASL